MKGSLGRLRFTAIIIFFTATVVALVFGLIVFHVYRGINFEADEKLFESAAEYHSTTFYANGADDGEDYDPVAIEISGTMRKLFYSYDEISPYLKDGFVAVEDKIFYEHKGIDLKRTILAAFNYVFKREKRFGASTITQQVVKNISGDNQISLKRKMEEIIRAIHIERKYTKQEILEVYLNVIPMSENIYGVGAASRAYFGKEQSELFPEEAATLIGITNAPTAYNPYINPDACKKKRNIVLSVMHLDGVIDDTQYEAALNSDLGVVSRENREDRIDSWFVETVIDDLTVDLAEKYGIALSTARMMLLGGGYKVYTTMNPVVQSKLEEYFENENNFPIEIDKGLNYAMVVTDTETGDLVGIIGRVGKKNGNRLLNHATTPHIPGSTLKPIALYAPLIDEGKINWATVFDDVPVSFIENNGEYREYPHNSPNVYDGLTTVKDALRNSKNTIAVRLCNLITPKKIFNSLKTEFGFETLIEREKNLTDIAIAPMALGQLGRGVSLRALTEGYGALSGDGVWRESNSYVYLLDHNGRIVIEKEKEERQVFKRTTARIMNQLLMTVVNDGTAKSITIKEKVNTAGKTGTSGGSRDKSFIGYTPYYTAGIWCGYDTSDRAVTGLTKSHLEVWDEVMTDIHRDIFEREDIREFSKDGLYKIPYCMDSGGLFTDNCIYDPRGNRQEYGYFTEDNQPTGYCDRHIICAYDSETKAIACPNCPLENMVKVSLLNINDRAFPKEIEITDAELVYRDIDGYIPRPVDYTLPYFQYTIPDGVFVGRSKNKKQFNSNCYLHDD